MWTVTSTCTCCRPSFSALLDEGQRFHCLRSDCRAARPTSGVSPGPRSLGFAVAEWLGRRAARAAARRGIAATPCWGVLYAGHLTVDRARGVRNSLPPHAHGQIICHPGDDDRALSAQHPWAYAWETELATVLTLASLELKRECPGTLQSAIILGRLLYRCPHASYYRERLARSGMEASARRQAPRCVYRLRAELRRLSPSG